MRFERVSFEAFRKDMLKCGWTEEVINSAYERIRLPERKTAYSAGYDFITCVPFILNPGHKITIPTGIKCYFEPDEAERWHLQLFIRSSIGIKKDVVMSNQTGIIDSDYYGNPENDGDMLIALKNIGYNYVRFNAGDRIIQGVFMQHGLADEDNAVGERHGGVGSTDQE